MVRDKQIETLGGHLTHQVHLQSACSTGVGTQNLVPSRRAHNLMPSALAGATYVRRRIAMPVREKPHGGR